MMKNKITLSMSIKQINSVLKQGGEIEFETGKYTLTAPLILHSNTKMNLNGSTLRQGGEINHLLLTYSNNDTVMYNGVSNVEVYNGTLEGMGKYGTPLNLMTLCHASNIYIHHMTFLDTVGFHSLEINSSLNVDVQYCNFCGYNCIDSKNDFREAIQIDWAIPSALVVVPLGSPWYDGTPCRHISIQDCVFTKSESRPAPSYCIGNHCQYIGSKHDNILVAKNNFTGYESSNPGGCCLSLIGMENVIIRENCAYSFGRFCRIYTASYSYDLFGSKIPAQDLDGICSNIRIVDNIFEKPSHTYVSSGVYVTSKTGKHSNILLKHNIIKKCKNTKMKYAVDVNHADCVLVDDTDTDALIKIGTTCSCTKQI